MADRQEGVAASERGWPFYKVLLRIVPNWFWVIGALVGVLGGALVEGFQDGRRAWVWMWTK